MAEARITRDDVESAVAAREELGPEMEPVVIDVSSTRSGAGVEARAGIVGVAVAQRLKR